MNEIQADEAGYERGWEQAEDYWRAKERERIINVLTALANFKADTQSRIEHKLALQALKDALIKGENK